MKITGILLTCGYAESSSNTTTCLDWKGGGGFDAAEDIVRRFYGDVYEILAKPTPPSSHAKCCKATLAAIPGAIYCACCRKTLQEDPPDAEDYGDYLCALAATVDGSSEMAEELEAKGWDLFGSFRGTYAYIDAADYAVLFPTTSTANYSVVTIETFTPSRPVKSLKLDFLKKLNQ